MEIARALLDHGADPNALWQDQWGSLFTVLTGAVGEGEGVKPPHPKADELVALLLQHGASPFDGQALYNDSIVGDDTHWLEVLWNASVARGVTERVVRRCRRLRPDGQQPAAAAGLPAGQRGDPPPREARGLAAGTRRRSRTSIHVYSKRRLLELGRNCRALPEIRRRCCAGTARPTNP